MLEFVVLDSTKVSPSSPAASERISSLTVKPSRQEPTSSSANFSFTETQPFTQTRKLLIRTDFYQRIPRREILLPTFLSQLDRETASGKSTEFANNKYCLSFNHFLYFRFAVMEEKILVSSILRKYNLRSTVKPSDIPLLAEVILRPKHGINISVEKRL